MRVTNELTEICAKEGFEVLGWAACEAKPVRACNGATDVIRTGHAANDRHLDIVKIVEILETDDAKTKRKKARLVAESLTDCFNRHGNYVLKGEVKAAYAEPNPPQPAPPAVQPSESPSAASQPQPPAGE